MSVERKPFGQLGIIPGFLSDNAIRCRLFCSFLETLACALPKAMTWIKKLDHVVCA